MTEVVDGTSLQSLRGVKFKETVLTAVSTFYPVRHFAVAPSSEGEPPLGPLTLFSFIAPTKCEKISYNEQHKKLRAALHSHLSTHGTFLDTQEKGVLFPAIHFTNDRECLQKCLKDEHLIENDYLLYQGVYREVRSIRPESDQQNSHLINPDHIRYILLGFKSLDKNFNQVMVDSWKDWTGARHIYMYLPDELGLSRISFYHREAPNSLNMFLYLVLVECHAINTAERQIKLLDFAQRMRAERMSGYISVYSVTQPD